MKGLSIVLVSASLALAACGGKGKQVSSARSPGGEGDDPATPFDDAAVKAAVTSTPGIAACGADPASTMGAHFAAEKAALKGDGSIPVNETFMCRAQADDTWACQWALFTAPAAAEPAESAEPTLDDPCAAAGAEDPCAGESTGFIIMFTVSSRGALVRDSITCTAPG